MQHSCGMCVSQGRQQRYRDLLQLGPEHAIGSVDNDLVEGWTVQQLKSKKGAPADRVDMIAVWPDDVRVIETTGQGVLTIEQGVGVRVGCEVVVQRFQCDPGLWIMKLVSQQVANLIHRAHAADPEQSLNPIAVAQQFRQGRNGIGGRSGWHFVLFPGSRDDYRA